MAKLHYILLGVLALTAVTAAYDFGVDVEDEEEEGDDIYLEFIDWLKLNGMSPTKLEPNPNGPGMVAAQDLKKGENIASIPKKVKLNVKAGMTSPFGKVITELQEAGVTDREILCIYLLFEKHRTDEESFWWAYIESLPQDVSSIPISWSEEDRAFLQGGTGRLTEQAINNVKGLLAKVEAVTEAHADLLDPVVAVYDEVKWAYQIVNSRAWLLNLNDQTFTLQPFADQITYSHENNVVTETSKAGRTLLTAAADIAKGELVTLYKLRDSAGQFLQSYGFLPDMSSNFLALSYQPALDPNDHFSGTVVSLLRSMQCFYGDVQYVLELDGDLPEDFVNCLRVVQLSPPDFAAMFQYELDTKEPFVGGPAGFSLRNTRDTLATLHDTFTTILSSYPTALEDDEELYAAGGLSTNAKAAVELRIHEKQLLKHGLKLVEDRWMSLLLNDPYEDEGGDDGDNNDDDDE